MAHKLTEPYSGKNPVPQIATKLTALINPQRATEAKAAQLQDQSGTQDQKQTEKRARRLAKGHVMHVVDPVTGEEMDIRNANEELDTRNKGENVLDTDFPPPDWSKHRQHVLDAVVPSVTAIVAAYVATFILTHLFANSLVTAALALLLPTALAYVLLFRLKCIARTDFDDRVWHAERLRGLRAGDDLDGDGEVGADERTKESAEWANAVLRGVWPIMNADLFSSLIDMLEDIMQASVPKFVHSVRIADVGLGQVAGRITAIRSLPDSKSREEVNEKDEKDENPEEQKDLDEQHVNLEVSFAYRGLPSGDDAKSKARNIHLLVEFFPGSQGWYGFKLPVWVEVTGVIGTARARLQLISDPPFVKTTMVSLMGLPRVTISVVALSRALPNVMNLPFISGFISSSIDTAVAEYVAPKSLTVDLQRLISGDDIKKDTDAIGVLIVHIHRAMGVRRSDANGSSADPYLTLTYSRLGQPLYSTRIIKTDCNPVFEETAAVLVDVNTIRLREKLSFQLWDSDRMSVDDLLGVADVDILELVRASGQPHRRVARLHDRSRPDTPGTLEYTVGYYAKRPPTRSLRSDGQDPGVPPDLRERAEFKNAKEIALNDLEAAVLVTPPDPAWPSGILSVQVHEIRGLGVRTEGRERNVVRTKHAREGEKGQDEGGQEIEEAEGLPSSYCTISLNDELVYQTRVKPITSTPIFNAGTERVREKDAVLGVVMLKLSELLVNGSQLTRLYSLEQGLGYGRIRLSVLFRPVEAKLPQNLLGFDTGTLEIRDLSVKLDENIPLDLSKCEVRIKTTKSGTEEKVSRKNAQVHDDGSVSWASDDTNLTRIPVRTRYGTALLLSFKDSAPLVGARSAGRKALAVLWLRDIADNDARALELPLWNARDGDYSRLKLNYSPPDGDLRAWDADAAEVRRVGTVRVALVFRPGIADVHRTLLDGGGATRKEAWEAFTREHEGGLREHVGEPGEDRRNEERRPEELAKRRGSSDAETQGADSDWTHAAHEGEGGEGEDRSAGGETGGKPGSEGRAEDASRPEINTMLSSEAVENAEVGEEPECDEGGEEGEDGEVGDDEGEHKKGVKDKLREWRQHEKDLHKDHRGIMQLKPARTAEWVKDNVGESMHHVKDRFAMKTRKPGVETEV
ncbi:C2 domain-containing protein [Phanerochaete sordida]|uniref:C2 domain-containing protein n=1 Tax=Phanerochaete sordida TaxID=48140 RepID=A0A9P3GMX3_9APHY|nr:C2 domain-containing protein [Phanerochaete sordida]